MNNKYLYLVVGKSGTGKSSLISRFCNLHDCEEVKSYTTRGKRTPNENTHTFISREEYVDKFCGIGAKQIVAISEFAGEVYFATKNQIKNSVFYTIDVPGIHHIMTKRLDYLNKGICVIEITAPLHRRILRLLKRDGLVGTIKRLYKERKNFRGIEKIPRITMESTDKFYDNFDQFEDIVFETEIGNNDDKCLKVYKEN